MTGLDLYEFRITAHMAPNVDIDGLLKALTEMIRAVGGNGIGYGAERLRVGERPIEPLTREERRAAFEEWRASRG